MKQSLQAQETAADHLIRVGLPEVDLPLPTPQRLDPPVGAFVYAGFSS